MSPSFLGDVSFTECVCVRGALRERISLDGVVDIGEPAANVMFEVSEQEWLHVVALVVFDLKAARFENLNLIACSANCVGDLVEKADLGRHFLSNKFANISSEALRAFVTGDSDSTKPRRTSDPVWHYQTDMSMHAAFWG